MKNLIKYFLSTLLIFSGVTASADGGDAAGAVIVTFVAAKGLAGMQLNSLEALELPEWKEKRSDNTAELGMACGFQYEARLLGNIRANFFWLSLKNLTDTEKSYNPIDTEFQFSDGTRRRPDLFRFDRVYFEPNRLYGLVLPFPDKENFANQSKLTVKLMVEEKKKPCEITIDLVRNPEVKDTVTTTTPLNIFDITAFVGGYSLSGDLADLGESNGGAGGISMNLFGGAHHGLYFSLYSLGQTRVSSEYATKYGVAADSKLSLSTFNFGYVYRHILKKNSEVYANVGFGAASAFLRDEAAGTTKNPKGRGLVDLGVSYRHTFSRIKSGVWIGNYYWGADARYFVTGSSLEDSSNSTPSGSGAMAGLHIGVGI